MKHPLTKIVAWHTVFLFIAVAMLSGCAAPRAIPLTSSGNQFGASADEAKLIAEGKRLHEDLVRKGMLLESEAMVAYIEHVGRPLVPPETASTIDIRFSDIESAACR